MNTGNLFREWLQSEVEKFISEKRLNMKSFAEQAGISYYSLYEFMKRNRSLKDDDIAKLLQALGYNLIPEKKKLVYEVCDYVKIECGRDLLVVPVYRKLDEQGKPDFASRVGVVCVKEACYCVELSDNRAFPFTYKSVIVAFKPVKDITGDGYYLFMPYSSNSVMVREVRLINGFIVIKLYNPEDMEVYAQDDLIAKMKVVGRVLSFTVQVV